nr:hypothetical protein BaRGS_007132 [Batillaria attramentaria]
MITFLNDKDVWIRQGSVGFIAAVGSGMDVADLHVKLLPKVAPFLKRSVMQLSNQKFPTYGQNPKDGGAVGKESRHVSQRFIPPASRVPDIDQSTEKWMMLFHRFFRKLNSLGMSEAQENKLLAMKEFMLKLQRARAGIDNSSTTPMQIIDFDKENRGVITDLAHFDTGAQSMLVFSTVNGHVVGWDLRMDREAWVLKNNLEHGLITTAAVHPTQSWLAVGTSSGIHVCWDLRFQLAINTVTHPTGARVRRIVMHPKKQSWLVSAVQWNNEVSMWDVESEQRQEALWASPHPPLTQRETNGHTVHGLYMAATDTHGLRSDGRLPIAV